MASSVACPRYQVSKDLRTIFGVSPGSSQVKYLLGAVTQ